jgi:hypothetical protein
MNPLQSTGAKILAHGDGQEARAALTKPYKDDLAHFLSGAEESAALAADGKDFPMQVIGRTLMAGRRVCTAARGSLARWVSRGPE